MTVVDFGSCVRTKQTAGLFVDDGYSIVRNVLSVHSVGLVRWQQPRGWRISTSLQSVTPIFVLFRSSRVVKRSLLLVSTMTIALGVTHTLQG